MRKSRINKLKQNTLIEHFVAGTTARCAAELIKINSKTAAYYYRRIREIIASRTAQECEEIFGGEIEADESYSGGTQKGKRGRGADGKIPVYPDQNKNIMIDNS